MPVAFWIRNSRLIQSTVITQSAGSACCSESLSCAFNSAAELSSVQSAVHVQPTVFCCCLHSAAAEFCFCCSLLNIAAAAVCFAAVLNMSLMQSSWPRSLVCEHHTQQTLPCSKLYPTHLSNLLLVFKLNSTHPSSQF